MPTKTQQPVLDVALEPKDESSLPAVRPESTAVARTANSVTEMIIELASRPEFDPAKLQALIDMQERADAKKAESAFNTAMAAAQAEMRPIAPDKYNSQTKSQYAGYDAIDKPLRPIYTKHGFGLSFNTEASALQDHIDITCDVAHIAGHTKKYRISMPADGKGAKGGDVMTKTHAVGSAVSYGMRYLLKAIFNVAIGEDDDDGNEAGGAQPAPEGFDEWLAHMTETAKKGTSALTAAWHASDNAYKNFILVKDWEGMKKVAKAADAERKNADA